MLALTMRKGSPTLAELARPTLRLAGVRVDPKNNGAHRTATNGGGYAITLKRIGDGRELAVTVPPKASVSNVHFSPDGSRLSFTNSSDAAIELWIADTTTGRARKVSGTDRLNAANGDPCDWLHDSVTMICQLVPPDRGPAPVEALVPAGPNVLESHDKEAPAPTYEDMIRTSYDEALFEYDLTSQLAVVDTTSGRRTTIGRPAIVDTITPSPDDRFILVSRVTRPYSHLIPMDGFPQQVEIWDRRGEVARSVAEIPSHEGVTLTGVRTGPRDYRWRPDRPATLMWVEALDGGDLKNKVPFRDKIVSVDAPFTASPLEFAKTEYRFQNLSFTEKGIALLGESDRATRRVRTWIVEPGAPPRKLWERRGEDRYADRGTPLIRGDQRATISGGRGGGPSGPIMQSGEDIYLAGDGASPEGDRPFLDRLNLKTLATERLFRSDATSYESPIAPLATDGTSVLTRAESRNEPPNYYTRAIGAGASRKTVTTFTDPQEFFRGVERQFITYARKDGVKLSATLYLPPGYTKGERLPVVMWAYPREFSDADTASQVVGSPNRFTLVTPGSTHMYLLFAGLRDPRRPDDAGRRRRAKPPTITMSSSSWPARKPRSTRSSRWASPIEIALASAATATARS